ncbi:hypothetical protein SCHPADRAFT_932062 [Schizopora paradoxa]|uniref:Uncharacterized protein n=1 Tax=Schizopora paradoxa TaxID=27342 RepID=A0A0H2RT63_9AGAM|nr:hypothetical protein SCHPADRAFT_932062 [Schizopora paradoxa]
MSPELSVNQADLDDLLVTLQSLKKDGYQTEDGRWLWCSGWLKLSTNSTKISSETLAQSAKDALSRMKNLKRTMALLTGSLQNTIQKVTEHSADVIRSVGFASLPDEVIAHVLELLSEDYHAESIWDESTCHWSRMLTSVCGRLRRIALHLPRLWEKISVATGKHWVACVRKRCQNPDVHFVYEDYDYSLTDTSIRNFLQVAHPTDAWKSLRIAYGGEDAGHMIFQRICPDSRNKFTKLKYISIKRGDYDFPDDDEVETSTTLLNESEHQLLADWCIPNVEVIELGNIIPRALSCPSLKDLSIHLNEDRENPNFHWDIDALGSFLRHLVSIHTLTLKFGCATVSPDDLEPQEALQPVRLLRLTKLKLEINILTEDTFLRRITEVVDGSNVFEISVTMNYEYLTDSSGPNKWISAVFETRSGTIRTFPNVEILEIVFKERHSYEEFFYRAPRFDIILRAVPKVRSLSIWIPNHISLPNLHLIREEFGCLKDLQSLCVKYYDKRSTYDWVELLFYFGRLESQGELDQFKRLELAGFSKHTSWQEDFEQLLGERFIWRD